MLDRVSFLLFDGPEGDMLADFGLAESVEISDGEHGFEALTAVIPMPEEAAYRFYSMPGVPWAVLSPGWGIAWEGRVEDVAVVEEGLQIGAFGGWRALSDVPYTALWSRTTTAGWRAVTDDDTASRTPEQYEIDNNNRLYLALRKGETYGNGVDIGELTYAAPHLGERGISDFSATYSITLPTNWQFRLLRCNEDFSSQTVIQTITGTGANLTGTINQTFTADERLLAQVRNNTGGNYTLVADTGTYFAKLTAIRIATDSGNVYTSEIAADIVSFINKTNADQLQDGTHLISVPYPADLNDELYEDEWPADILTELAGRGDDGQNQYETGIWENRTLYFRPRYSASRTWLVDAVNLTVNRTMDTLRNEMYAVYRDANNRLKRTATVSDESSGGDVRSGASNPPPFIRRGFVDVNSTSLDQAELERSMRLSDTAVLTPRAQFDVLGLYDEGGHGPYPLWMARAGDLVMVRNLSPGLGTAVDRIRNFRIKRKRYDVIADVLQLTPELELPDLAVMVGADKRLARPSGFVAKEG